MTRAAPFLFATLAACEPVPPERADLRGAEAGAVENYCACYWAESGFASPDDCYAVTYIDCTAVKGCGEAVACLAGADDGDEAGDVDGGSPDAGAGGAGLCAAVDECLLKGCIDVCEAAYRRVYDCCSLDVPEDVTQQARKCCGLADCRASCTDTAKADCNDIIGWDGCPY